MSHPDLDYLLPSDRRAGEGSGDWPALRRDERGSLHAVLMGNRELVVWKASGCDLAQLQEPSSPTGLTVLGIVQHLTMVERIWFRDRVAGQPGLRLPTSEQDWEDQFRLAPGATAEQVLAGYAAECRLADEAVGQIDLEDVPPDSEAPTLRWVYLHMIEETARHLGQIDLLREQADGLVGEDPDS